MATTHFTAGKLVKNRYMTFSQENAAFLFVDKELCDQNNGYHVKWKLTEASDKNENNLLPKFNKYLQKFTFAIVLEKKALID